MRKIAKTISWEIVRKTLLPLVVFLLFLAGYFFYKVKISLYISVELQQEFKKHLMAIFIFIIAFLLQRVIDGAAAWYKENIAAKTLIRLDDQILPLFRRISKTILWIIAFLLILPLYGVNISALIATLGVSSLAIALAAQDTISNIIAGFMIMVDSPFRIGDKIKLPSGEVVEALEVGIRRSKFLSQDKAIIIVPNLELSKSKIVNYTYGEERLKDNG
jgi:MscS family membrane protein